MKNRYASDDNERNRRKEFPIIDLLFANVRWRVSHNPDKKKCNEIQFHYHAIMLNFGCFTCGGCSDSPLQISSLKTNVYSTQEHLKMTGTFIQFHF
jgi:hypothetical protein